MNAKSTKEKPMQVSDSMRGGVEGQRVAISFLWSSVNLIVSGADVGLMQGDFVTSSEGS